MKKTLRTVYTLMTVLILLTLQIAEIPAGFAAGPTSHTITCENCEARDTDLNIIHTASAGAKVIVQFKRERIPDGKYTTQDILSDDVAITKDANGMQSFIMPDKNVSLKAALYDRKSGTINLTENDTVDADFELLDSLIFTNSFSAYEATEGTGSYPLDLNLDNKTDVTVTLNQGSKKASARREEGADDITSTITVSIHGRDGNDWSRKYKECIFNVMRTYCTVSFDANGGGGTMDTVRIQKGKTYTLPECGFTAPVNMAFDQWDKGKPGAQITVNSDLTVIAKWKMLPNPEPDPTPEPNPTPEPTPEPKPTPEPETCTIFFKANGGKGTMDPVTVTKGTKYTLPDCDFEAPNSKYEFKYWNKGKPGTKITVYKNITVKALWKKTAKKKTRILAKKKRTYNAGQKVKKYVIKLTDAKKKPVQKAKVTLKIDGKTYTATTNKKGKAIFKITNLKKKGTYNAIIRFDGNNVYKSCTKKVTIRLK